MAVSISEILDVLRARGILPLEDDWPETDLPGVGQIEDGETVYATSLDEVFPQDDEPERELGVIDTDDPRLREWWREIEQIIEEPNGEMARRRERVLGKRANPPEPHCAWYCPIHFFGYGWGIYIREICVLTHALDIASFVHWPSVRLARTEIARQMLRSAFYVFFLHEQFHHKVESLGLRLLIATGSDRYRPYKTKVYRQTFLTPNCLEESLANATGRYR
jgi:hypothetical protein